MATTKTMEQMMEEMAQMRAAMDALLAERDAAVLEAAEAKLSERAAKRRAKKAGGEAAAEAEPKAGLAIDDGTHIFRCCGKSVDAAEYYGVFRAADQKIIGITNAKTGEEVSDAEFTSLSSWASHTAMYHNGEDKPKPVSGWAVCYIKTGPKVADRKKLDEFRTKPRVSTKIARDFNKKMRGGKTVAEAAAAGGGKKAAAAEESDEEAEELDE